MKRKDLYEAKDKNNRLFLYVLVGFVCLCLFVVNGFPKNAVGADAVTPKPLKIGVAVPKKH
ncbi:MAG: hypothetical protein HZB37_07840 [Planctomycetes bacterium]|nr:hypothetical protein [Planctomycetota bacterium]